MGEGKRPLGSTPSPELETIEVLGEGDSELWGEEGMDPSSEGPESSMSLILAFVIQLQSPTVSLFFFSTATSCF